MHGGKKIEVSQHAKREDREQQGDKYTNLFVQNLPTNFTQDKLLDIFKPYGMVDSISMGEKEGTGFVNFKNHDDAKRALEEVNKKVKIENQSLLVSPHVSRKESELAPRGSNQNPIVQNQKEMFKSNVYVKFIPKEVTREVLEREFSKAGTINSIKLKDWENKFGAEPSTSLFQIGYVLYDDVKAAQKCIQLFDGSNVFGFGTKPLKVDFWQAKDDLKKARVDKNVNYVT